MIEKPWEGRFAEKTDRSVELFTSSIDVDKRLYAYDIDGSIAHCQMLAHASIITHEEAGKLIEGLGAIKREIQRGKFLFDHGLEDIHMHIETRLFQEVGKVAQKLHTARSRNDQVALDSRMYLREETRNIIRLLDALNTVIVSLAEENLEVIMPGYTHLQRAQPVLLSHHLMAYFEMFSRDRERFCDALKRINVLPLGSAALAGTTYPIDRHYTAGLLQFPEVSANSIDSVSDRDFMLEFLSCASIAMVHFSRLSEEMILWSSAEFGFVGLPDAFSTGSSIMPQKKNPDVPELVRGKAGRVFGDLFALLTLMKSLPMAYNRDMQEDKPAVFDAVDTLKACIEIYTAMLPKLRINKEILYQATTTGFLNATDLADYLVTKGMTFRESHSCVGKAVGYASSLKKELHELTLEEMKSFSTLIAEDIFAILTPEEMINRRTSFGGTARENVNVAIQTARQRLAEAVCP
ncbi:MAG: argininosuccinate lyase [Deltaproteobacteria bacterium]|nr:argininosuccinate lyase [Deltaproteobacteria bacterium]